MDGFGQDERAAMLAWKRDMPEGLYETGPADIDARRFDNAPGAEVVVRGGTCQCGNPWTIRRGDRVYCALCIPGPLADDEGEPCLCGEQLQVQCRERCILGADQNGA